MPADNAPSQVHASPQRLHERLTQVHDVIAANGTVVLNGAERVSASAPYKTAASGLQTERDYARRQCLRQKGKRQRDDTGGAFDVMYPTPTELQRSTF